MNSGDNIDDGLVSPEIFKRYMLPYYLLRTRELHQSGKFCSSHWDRKIRHVLKFARDTGLDGLEFVPPEPQGNMTLEKLRRGLENMILVDRIPATYFMPYTSEDDLKSFVQRILNMFSPNIILGISDMMPPDGDIERVRTVSKMVEEYKV
ncbi:MAG: uroporphyrinogen decarboxylase family protein [Nitrososphaeria archaeon]